MRKRLLLIATTLICLLASMEIAQAGNSANTRRKCRWYAKKYAVNCHLATRRCGLKYSWTHDGDCSWAYRDLRRTWCCGSESVSHSESSGSGHYRYLYVYCGVSGGLFSDLLMDAGAMAADEDPKPDPASEAGQVQRMIPEYGEREIKLSGIEISLSSPKGSTDDNTVTVAAWLPEDDTTKGVEDTLYEPRKAIVSGTVSLKGGKITVTGGIFKAGDFKMSEREGKTVVTYAGGDKILSIPKEIDMDLVAVHSGGDVLGDEKSLMKKLVEEESDGTAVLNLYPNPASSVLQVSLQQFAASDATVGIYDMNGKRVITQDITVANGTADLKIDIAVLPAGSYFVMIKGEDMKIVKQFTKQ